ncbi:hypothetical protein P3S68_016351 [Capsicum galapagoense]
MLPFLLEAVSESVNKAQYALLTTIEALESQVIEALRAKFPVPIFTVGPTIPYFYTEFKTNQPSSNYLSWLDDQPKDSDSWQGEEQVNYIPGITPIRLKDLPSVCHDKHLEILPFLLEAVSESVNKAQYALFTTIEALESQVIEALRAKFPVPIFTVGPTIPYFDAEFKTNQPSSNYLSWLDDQPKDSVLYISQGSFMSVSKEQLDEIIAGVHSSGVRSFWVVRENASLLTDAVGNKGIVVPWCDQLKVLCHPSVGGFWSHCGWNSIKEGAYAGIPFLTFPIGADQFTNSKQIVEDWKIGWRINKEREKLVKRDEIAMLLQSFMDLDNYHGKEMRRRAMEIRKTCQEAIEGGAIQGHIDKFIRDISHGPRQ